MASGPSLTVEDCDAARGNVGIVTNTTFRLAPWADVLFGFDSRWWRAHIDEVRKIGFSGRLISVSQVAGNLGVETTYGSTWFRGGGNSGASAIALALAGGAAKIVLLGFDCSKGKAGQSHWHGDHPKGLSNCLSMPRWPAQFARVAAEAQLRGVPVLNASRHTALKCFQRVELAKALA